MQKRILFTTHVGPNANFFTYAMPHQLLSINLPFPAMGLRFLKENVPGIEILEFPSWEEFEAELGRGVDVLGISFYTKDVPVVKRMVRLARQRYRVKEIWGGNYGVLTPGMERLFDRTFLGYAEDEVHLAVTGRPREGALRHPLILMKATAPLFPYLRAQVGIVFTHRGCNLRCTFCQTPVFAPTLSRIPTSEVKRVVDRYHKMGVNFLLFAEENFIPSLNRELLERLGSYGMQWTSQSRADSLRNRIHDLVRNTGYTGSIIGIESLRDSWLAHLDKRQTTKTVMETLREARDAGIFMQGTYIFGYEDDTPESLAQDAERLLRLPLLVNHYFILTPYPRTELAAYIRRRFGPPSQNWAYYDSRHLVWNHPHLEAEKLHAFRDSIRNRGWGVKDYVKMGLRTLRLFGRHIRLA